MLHNRLNQKQSICGAQLLSLARRYNVKANLYSNSVLYQFKDGKIRHITLQRSVIVEKCEEKSCSHCNEPELVRRLEKSLSRKTLK